MAQGAQAGGEGGAEEPARLTVVVADDAPGVLELMAQVLKTTVGQVVTARDGDAALRAIREHRPRVAILDAEMPCRTGLEVAAAIHADPELAGTRVLLVTGEASVEREAAAGVHRLLPKPFRARELVDAVRDLAE